MRNEKLKKSKELCSLWNNEQELQTGNVKISELHEFKGHPFRVEHDMQLFELSKSIGEKGIWYAVPLGWIIASTISVVRYKSGKWKNKSIVS